MAQAESNLSRKIMNALRIAGHFCFKVHGGETMMAGLPDIIVCAEGLFIGLETKVPGKEYNTSARQEFIHTKIRDAGGTATVVSSVEEALRVVGEAVRAARAGAG